MGFLFGDKKITPKRGTIAVVGLTGQSGSGKTMVSDYLGDCGYSIINADLVARAVTVRGSACNRELSKLFPDCVNEDLELDRRKLGSIVFNDKEKLSLLNDTIFPYINELIEIEIREFEQIGSSIVILDAPTLFEAGADKHCDMIISVISDDNLRENRIIKRDNLPREQVSARFASQKPKSFFVKHSDYVIENNGTKEALLNSVKSLFDKIKEQFNV